MTKEKMVVGLDVGSVKVSWVTMEFESQAVAAGNKRHQGNPIKVIKELMNGLRQNNKVIQIVATGAMSNILAPPVIIAPEQAAQEEACRHIYSAADSLNVLRLGGKGFSLLTCENGKFSFDSNDRCSGGTGVVIQGLCESRFKMSISEVCDLALTGTEIYIKTTRCAVFLESEIVSLLNQGYDKKNVAKSLFCSIANNIWSFVENKKVPGKFIIIGGVAKNKPIVNRFKELIKSSEEASNEVEISDHKDVFEALGALMIAFKLAKENSVHTPIDCENIFAHTKKTISSLPPLSLYSDTVIKHKSIISNTFEAVEADVGIDIGSTGTKIVSKDRKTDDILWTDYLPTEGDPVGVSQKLLKRAPKVLLEKVVAIGLTGSGRNVVAAVFEGANPELYHKVIVKTEITAHAKGAIFFDEDNGKDLLVIEIGGHDAKYTLLKDGQIVDTIMNDICASGTGSFLAKQSKQNGISNIQEFDRLACVAKSPANLGQQCTVFISNEVNNALAQGHTLADICAGLNYSVVNNYLYSVMGNRSFGEKIFLQGKPACDDGLPRAFAVITGKKVIVPPHPGEIGAFGIALCASEEVEKKEGDKYFDFEKFLNSKIDSRNEFNCRVCENACRIQKIIVDVDGSKKTVYYGGICPQYEKSKKPKLPQGAPNTFRKREVLFNEILNNFPAYDAKKYTIGIPNGLALVRFLPFFIAFFSELGFNVKILEMDRNALEKGNSICIDKDNCAPVKIMHGATDFTGIDYYCCPKIKSLPKVADEKVSCTCPLAQAIPNLIEFAVDQKVKFIKPILDLSQGINADKIKVELLSAALELDLLNIPKSVDKAFKEAVKVQKEFEEELFKIGDSALAYSKDKNLPVILVLGRLYILHNKVLNSGIPQAIQESGAIAIPIDCYRVRDNISFLDLMYWGEGQRNLRAVLDVLKRKNVFLLWLSCFSCGPDSFLYHFFNDLANRRPHTTLVIDGNSGIAHYITRIEAFLDCCRAYMKRERESHLVKSNSLIFEPLYRKAEVDNFFKKDVKLIIPSMGNSNQFFSAVFSSLGINSIALPPVDKTSFILGREDCSGDECLPFICLWGNIKECLMKKDYKNRPQEEWIFFVPTTEGPCRFCMYNLLIKQLVDKMGFDGKIKFYSLSTRDSYGANLGSKVQLKLWAAVVISDLLKDMLLYLRPISKDPDCIQNIYNQYKYTFISLLEKDIGSMWNVFGAVDLMKEAVNDFQNIAIDKDKLKNILKILMTGEIYVRQEPFANDYLIEKLEKYGMQVTLAPIREWHDYVTYFCQNGNKSWVDIKKEKFVQNLIASKLYNICANGLGWNKDHHIKNVVNAGIPYVGKIPNGEAVVSIGSSIEFFRSGGHGIVGVGPFGCMPNKIFQSQIAHTGVPVLFLAFNGDPTVDEQAIAAFAYQLGGIRSLM